MGAGASSDAVVDPIAIAVTVGQAFIAAVVAAPAAIDVLRARGEELVLPQTADGNRPKDMEIKGTARKCFLKRNINKIAHDCDKKMLVNEVKQN